MKQYERLYHVDGYKQRVAEGMINREVSALAHKLWEVLVEEEGFCPIDIEHYATACLSAEFGENRIIQAARERKEARNARS